MSTLSNIKAKMSLLEKQPITQVITDVIREVYLDVNNGEEAEGIGEIALGRYSQRVINRLQGQYRNQLKVEDMIPIQIDLLDVIQKVYEEEKKKLKEQ